MRLDGVITCSRIAAHDPPCCEPERPYGPSFRARVSLFPSRANITTTIATPLRQLFAQPPLYDGKSSHLARDLLSKCAERAVIATVGLMPRVKNAFCKMDFPMVKSRLSMRSLKKSLCDGEK